jgi:hypothetical protein
MARWLKERGGLRVASVVVRGVRRRDAVEVEVVH